MRLRRRLSIVALCRRGSSSDHSHRCCSQWILTAIHSITSSAAGEQRRQHGQAERLRGNQIDDKLELRRLLDWYIAGLRPAQNFIHVICRAPEPFGVTWSVRHEAPAADKVAGAEDCWKPRAKRKRKDAHEVGDHKLIDRNINRIRLRLDRFEGGTEILNPSDFEWRDFDAK